MNNESDEKLVNDAKSGSRPSWPYPTILILYLIIFLITPVTGVATGLALFFGLMGVCLWNAISENQFKKLKQNHPSLTRSDYLFNMIIFPVVVPLIVFVLLMVFKHFPL
jgi:hypothetical protein